MLWDATKIINHHSKAETKFKTDSPFLFVTKLFFIYKNWYFVNYEVRAGCPKFGHTTLWYSNDGFRVDETHLGTPALLKHTKPRRTYVCYGYVAYFSSVPWVWGSHRSQIFWGGGRRKLEVERKNRGEKYLLYIWWHKESLNRAQIKPY